MSKIEFLSLASIARKIKSRQLRSVEVAETFVQNIEKYSNLNAMIYFNKKQVLDDAFRLDKELNAGQIRGRLHGAPIVIKDNIHVKSMPNTAGCPGLKDFIPKEDAPVVRKLREEGALFLGKTNMHELAFGATSNNVYYGRVGNAHNAEYSAGGSSGGTGTAVVSRQASAGLGSDTGGSVRIPSYVNGVFGLRPTMKRYSQEGVTPLSHTRDTIGLIASHIEDIKLLDEIITGEKFVQTEVKLDQLRIGIPTGYLTADLADEVKSAFENAKKILSKNDVKLVEVNLSKMHELDKQLGLKIAFYECAPDIVKYMKKYDIKLTLSELIDNVQSPDVVQIFKSFTIENGSNYTDKKTYYRLINEVRPQLQNEYKRLFAEYNLHALAYPTLPCLPFKFTDNVSIDTLVRNNNPSSNAGIPSLASPMAKSQLGLPIGIQYDGLWNTDHHIIQIASAFHKLF